MDIDFRTVTEVVYTVPPVVNTRKTQTEIDLLSGCVIKDCDGLLIGKSACEQSFEDATTFTESPHCELERIRIFEDDTSSDCIYHKTNSKVKLYNKITEKMVIYITLKVLQLQQVNIPPTPRCDCDE